jgi:TolB-like protein/DNA-binding winged helix-turn-helix (wHTH) protein/Flp pilus assembly protein TadD
MLTGRQGPLVLDLPPTIVFCFGDAEFEQFSGMLRAGAQERRLRPQTAAVLSQLLEHAGHLVTHDQLVQAVWGDTVVTDNSLAQCISEIRGVLGSARDNLIETLPRRGYRLNVVVTQKMAHASTSQAPASAAVAAAAAGESIQNTAPAPAKPGPKEVRAVAWLFIGAGLTAVLLSGALWLGLKPQASAAPRISLAVLPFQSRTAGTDQAWFAEKVGDDLTFNLSRIPRAHVISSVSTQSYPAVNADVRQIGRELGVRYLVTGSVDREGDRVTLSLYLVDAQSGAILLTERFDTPLAALHATQRQVADRVAYALQVRLVATEASRIESKASGHPAAEELALQSWAAWSRGGPADLVRAKELADKAVALDERSVIAWKTIASWYLRARVNQSLPAEVAVAGAEAAARRAMDIDPDHTLVHTVYGGALAYRGQYDEARRALEHEIATNPSHPMAYNFLALTHLMMADSRAAVDFYQRTLAVSPRDPRMSRFHRHLALSHLHEGDLPAALRHAKAATEAPQVDRSAWAMLASVCALAGDAPCASSSAAKLRQLWPNFTPAQAESEWPPARAGFTAKHGEYLRGLTLAGLVDKMTAP